MWRAGPVMPPSPPNQPKPIALYLCSSHLCLPRLVLRLPSLSAAAAGCLLLCARPASAAAAPARACAAAHPGSSASCTGHTRSRAPAEPDKPFHKKTSNPSAPSHTYCPCACGTCHRRGLVWLGRQLRCTAQMKERKKVLQAQTKRATTPTHPTEATPHPTMHPPPCHQPSTLQRTPPTH